MVTRNVFGSKSRFFLAATMRGMAGSPSPEGPKNESQVRPEWVPGNIERKRAGSMPPGPQLRSGMDNIARLSNRGMGNNRNSSRLNPSGKTALTQKPGTGGMLKFSHIFRRLSGLYPAIAEIQP